nr:uncharacterized protein LOC109739094 isoform X2 [Aegilops tauschii subsp. strangulata]
MATDRPQAEDSGSDNGPPPARTHTVRRWCQRAAAAAGPAGAAVDEGRGGSAHRAHQGRRQDHLRPLQLLHFRHLTVVIYTGRRTGTGPSTTPPTLASCSAASPKPKVWQHRRVDDEGGDRGGERRELVAAGLDGMAHICASD